MTDHAIEGLRLAEKATPAPWKFKPASKRCVGLFGDVVGSNGQSVVSAFRNHDDTNLCGPDTDLIAHAGTHYASICKRALDAEAKLLEAHKALDACHAAYAPTAEAAQLLSVHLVEAHGADLYGKPHSETIRCAHAKLAAMQRVVDAAVEVSAATTELAELHAIKRLDEAVRAMKEKRDHE